MRKDAKEDSDFGLILTTEGTEYTKVFSGEACLPWFLEFGFLNLSPLVFGV
tara:strand:- start:51 stop:203 length:153 start_codon:yes stop_codon:yes gene_type:complete